ncbi:MAG: tetratricopeptide repeat protein [Nitrospira sp.]|nr:tetratricopeptide repeat protein [Nitrospira sp.]
MHRIDLNERPAAFHPQAFAAMAALALLLTLSACGGPQERKAQYRAKAQDYIQAGNFPKARVALRNVLKIDPKDAEAFFLMAQVEERKRTGATRSPTTNRSSSSCRTIRRR